MAQKPAGSTKFTRFRRQVEERLRTMCRDVAAMPVKDVQQLVHNLEAYQVELEMQNDELRRAQMELEAARDRYVDLYDFSPAGHLTLDMHGTIVEANLRVGTLLGINRNELIGQPLARFLASDDQDLFRRHCQEVLKTGTRQTCEVHLGKEASASCCVYLESLAVHEEPGCVVYWRTSLLDISDRKRAEAASTLLAAIVESSDDGIVSTNLAGSIVTWNQGAEQLFGYTREEIIGQSVTRIIPADRLDEKTRIFDRIRRGEPVPSFDTIRQRKDGSLVPVSIVASPLKNKSGTIIGAAAIICNITERRRMEELLLQSNERFRITMLATNDAVWDWDIATNRVWVNDAFTAVYGYTSENNVIRLETWSDNRHPDDNPRVLAEFQELFERGGTTLTTQYRFRRSNGSYAYIYERSFLVRDLNGAPIRMIGSMTDITERKLLQEKFRRVVEGAPNAMILVNQKGAIVLVNVQTERLFGYVREELLGLPIETLVPAWFRGAHPGHRAAFFADPKARTMGASRDLYGLRKDGREIPIEISLNPVETEDGLMVLSSIVDITKWKRAAAEILKRDQLLESANKELEAFSYTVSHDLRAPLRSLDGFGQALLEDCAGQLSEQGKDYLNRVRAASQRMGQLIDDLLNLSRVAREEMLEVPVDLSALALGSADEVRKIWRGRQVELVVAPGLRARGDPRLLRIVFDNLLGNAWKFTSKQERAVIEVGAMLHDGATAYFVRDNGVGFDMAYADKLFGAFQRLHGMTEYPGTGIGLATVRRIVTRHGGRVWGEGHVGQGATFYFTLSE